jgi:hypothetical protein
VLYALMCDDAAAGGHDTRQAVDAVLADWADQADASAEQPGATPRRPGPDPATWGLMPHQIGRAEAAQRLGAG